MTVAADVSATMLPVMSVATEMFRVGLSRTVAVLVMLVQAAVLAMYWS